MGASASKDGVSGGSLSQRPGKFESKFGAVGTHHPLFGSLALSRTQCDDAPPPPPPPGSEAGTAKASKSVSPDNPNDDQDDAIAKAAAEASAYRNPGPFENATMDCKRLTTLDTFDGFRCDINKQVSPYMAVVHNFWLGTNMIPDGRKRTYTWLTQVADTDSLLMARVDPSRLSVDGRIHKALMGGLVMTKLQLGLSPDGQSDQALAEADINGMSWAANLKYGSMGGGIVYGCNYLQAITPNFHMGGEGMFISANQTFMSNYLLKYTLCAPSSDEAEDAKLDAALAPKAQGASTTESPSSTICASFNSTQAMLTLNYKRVVTPNRVTLGGELVFSPMKMDSQVVLGAEFKFARSKLQVTVDGSAKMQSVLEAKMGKEPGQPTILLSADLDHFNDEMKFGYGLQIDG